MTERSLYPQSFDDFLARLEEKKPDPIPEHPKGLLRLGDVTHDHDALYVETRAVRYLVARNHHELLPYCPKGTALHVWVDGWQLESRAQVWVDFRVLGTDKGPYRLITGYGFDFYEAIDNVYEDLFSRVYHAQRRAALDTPKLLLEEGPRRLFSLLVIDEHKTTLDPVTSETP